MPSNNNGNSNQLLVPGVRQALDQMKNEIANEFGVKLDLIVHRVPTDPSAEKLQSD